MKTHLKCVYLALQNINNLSLFAPTETLRIKNSQITESHGAQSSHKPAYSTQNRRLITLTTVTHITNYLSDH